MAIARVASNDSDGQSTVSPVPVAYVNAPAVGNLLIVTFASANGVGTISATGWTIIKDAPYQAGARTATIAAKISAGASDQNISFTNTGAGTTMWNAFEYSGAASTIVQDGTAGASQDAGSAVATLASASITLGNTGSLIIFARSSANTDGGGNTWTNGTLIAANQRTRISTAEWLPGSGGAKSSTNSWNTAQRSGMAVAAFRPPVATTTKTQPAKSRIQVTTTQTQLSKTRIIGTATQPINGQSRITQTTAQTQSAKASLNITTAQTIAGVSNIQIGVTTTPQTIPAKSRVTATTAQTIPGKSRITVTTAQTIAGLSRLTQTVSKTIQSIARIGYITVQTIPGLSRITASTTKTQPAKSSIRVTTTQTQPGQSRITQSVAKTIITISRVTTTVTKTITSLARVTATTAKTISAVANVRNNTLKTQTAISRIVNTVSKTIAGLSRISILSTQTQISKSRIQVSTTQTQTAKSRITQIVARTITAISRLTAVATKTITGVGNVSANTTRTITGLATMGSAVAKTIQGLARVTATASQTITSIARLTKTTLKTITAKSRVTKTVTKTQLGKMLVVIGTLIDSYDISNENLASGTDATHTGQSQSFTGNGKAIGTALWYLSKTGSPTGNAVAKVYAITGTFGTNSKPTGVALATSDPFDVTTLSTSLAIIGFTFSGANQIVLTNGTNYAITIEHTGGDSSNHLNIGEDNSSPTHAGNAAFLNSGTWTASGNDLCFYVYDTGFTVTTQTVPGLARLTALATKLQTGLARIGYTTLQTIGGITRVTKIVSKTQTGLGRIQITSLGRSRVLYDGFEATLGLWTVGGAGGTITQDTTVFQAGLQSVKFVTSTNTATLTNTLFPTNRTEQAYYAFQYYHTAAPSASTQIIRLIDASNTIVTGFKIDVLGRLVGKNADSTDGAVVGTLSNNTWHLIEHWYDPSTGANRALIDGTTYGAWTNSGTNPWSKIQFGVANAATYTNYFDEMNVYIGAMFAKSRILVTSSQAITGKGDVKLTTLQTILGRGSLANSTNQTIGAISRIRVSVLKTITAKSRVTTVTQRIIAAKAAIFASTTKVITGIGRVGYISTKIITGKSKLIGSKSITGKALIAPYAPAQGTIVLNDGNVAVNLNNDSEVNVVLPSSAVDIGLHTGNITVVLQKSADRE